MRKHLENMIAEHKSHMEYAVSNNLPNMYEVCEQTIQYLSQHPAMQEGEKGNSLIEQYGGKLTKPSITDKLIE